MLTPGGLPEGRVACIVYGMKARIITVSALVLLSCTDHKAPPDARGAGTPAASSPQAPVSAPGIPQPHHGIEIIDAHVHIVPEMTALAQALEVLEKSGVTRFVAFSGGEVGSLRYAATVAMKRVLGERFHYLVNIDWDDFGAPGFVEETVFKLRQAADEGARGLKIFKALGLKVRSKDGKLVAVDDPVLDPIFEECGKLGLVVAIHVADPAAFFKPVTPDNERYDELSIASSWSFHGSDYPSFDELMAQQERRVARHPKTTFILVHMGNNAEDLGYVASLLDKYPNVLVNTAARVPEFGRHPAGEVRAFFIKYQDRIMFGSDFVSTPHGMQLGSVSKTEPTIPDGIIFFNRHWEYFETDHRQMDHPTPIQGNWKVDAIHLPPEVLRKLYHDVAWNLFFAFQSHSRPGGSRWDGQTSN